MLTIRYIDTCLPCYLTDHFNGENESLVGVPVNGSTTYGEIREALETEIRWTLDRPEGLTGDDIASALSDLFENVTDPATRFDSSLETPTDDDDGADYPSAWFRLSWESATVTGEEPK